jgi:hypothetical protein
MLRDSDASFCKPSACGLPQSVVPPASEPGTRLHAESHADRNEARQLLNVALTVGPKEA